MSPERSPRCANEVFLRRLEAAHSHDEFGDDFDVAVGRIIRDWKATSATALMETEEREVRCERCGEVAFTGRSDDGLIAQYDCRFCSDDEAAV